MNLDFWENLSDSIGEGIKDFLNELSNYLERNASSNNAKGARINNGEVTESMERTSDNLKREGCLYQVVEANYDSAYLYNASTGITSKEADISKDLLKKIGTDYILKYTNGEYVWDENETSKFFDSMVSVGEYSKIKETFNLESGIATISPDMQYTVQSCNANKTILSYGEKNTIEVPNELIPYFAKQGTVLRYENKTFKIDFD